LKKKLKGKYMSDVNQDVLVDHLEEENPERNRKKRKSAVQSLSQYVVMSLLSITLHLFLLFVISLIPAQEQKVEEEVTIITDFEEEESQEEEIEEIEKIELEVTEVEVEPVESEVEAVVEEELLIEEEPMESLDDSMDELLDLIPDDTSAESDISSLAVMGLNAGASGSSGLPSGYSQRSGKAKGKAIKRGGGDAKTEQAVDAALKWLAEHQESDGSWDHLKHEGHGKEEEKVAMTAAALLPFLGAGHNEMAGKYKKTVRKGIQYLNGLMSDPNQLRHPYFRINNYGVAMVLMALSESSLFGSSPTTSKNANILAEYFIKQYVDKPGQGWFYGTGGDDLSVSGWVALGLKSAKSADLPAMRSKDAKLVFKQYKKWVSEVMCDTTTGMGFYRESGERQTVHMAWVGMFQKQFLGFPRSDAFLKLASEKSLEWIGQGKWVGGDGPGDVYGIYYGTLANFQQQGDAWRAWNPAMKKTVVGSQRTGDPKKFGGSWDPTKGHTGERGGRVLTTALMALCLEVYYRYDVM
jgi:hypothetical protein